MKRSGFGAPHGLLRVVIVGTGAMASLVGARLADTGCCDVTLVGTWRAALDAIGMYGLTVVSEDGEWTVPVSAVPIDRFAGKADLAIVLVKALHTADAAGHIARFLADQGVVLTLQNGLGNRTALEEHVGEERVLQGVTSVGATLAGPGRVRAGGPGRTVIGASVQPQDAEEVVELFGAAGFATELVDDIAPHVWRKLAVNCAINPLSALLRMPNGDLLSRPEPRATLESAAREVGEVAAAQGISLDVDPVDAAVSVARLTATNRSSMLQDLERGAPTEIDAINGAVVRSATELDVPTPVNEYLWQQVKALESRHLDTATIDVKDLRFHDH